MKKEIWFKYMY